LAGLASLIFTISLNSRMGRSIADNMRGIWKASMSGRLSEYRERPLAFSIRTNVAYKWAHDVLQRKVLPLASAIAFGYLLIAVASHVSFNFFDAAGLVCVESSDGTDLLKLAPGKTVEVMFDTSNLCQSTKVLLGVASY
jgi:hypothetical protein